MDPTVFSADKWLLDFVGANWFTLGLILGLFHILVKTPWTTPREFVERIVRYLSDALSGFRRPKDQGGGK